ncbi:hypothetical protein DFR86_03410 [Acidianus sulfidivorans JP7]|uniref:Uncharacterized protein n=1 Tax=Acidianus sulfidivorans JP7 TaxID=619593 RepID=A0A2U9IL00_9CREN|nr:hypothetical protein [Acidianus sulfidivorans]AWR96696.1 hypothetical protein DFR86_03410 [Acidianus sulfidivorans JP7]
MSLVEEAFKEFISNIVIILPVIIITVIGYVIIIILSHFIFSPFSLIENFVLGLTLSYSASASLGYYLYKKIDVFLSYLGPSTISGLILGLFFLIFSILRIPIISLMLDALALAFNFLLLPSIYRGKIDVGETIDWISRSISLDFISFLILYILCLFSFYPVIDIITISVSSILSYLMRIRI